jgi:hypothetical protein
MFFVKRFYNKSKNYTKIYYYGFSNKYATGKVSNKTTFRRCNFNIFLCSIEILSQLYHCVNYLIKTFIISYILFYKI